MLTLWQYDNIEQNLIKTQFYERYLFKIYYGFLNLSMNISNYFLILRRTESDMIKSNYSSSPKVPLIVFMFQRNFIFSSGFLKNIAKSNCMDIRPVGADLLPKADGRTERRTEKDYEF